MIKALIIEDEKLAVDHLIKLISGSKFQFTIAGTLNTVSSAIDWFGKNEMPDLVFLDVQLADGISFEIFSYIKITCPIIFTTAFQEYAIKAFKVNTVDYLLKPILNEDFELAIEQYFEKTNLLGNTNKQYSFDFKMDSILNTLTKQYKSRFVINIGLRIQSIEVQTISYFKSLEGDTYLIDFQGKSYDIDYSLDQLESLLDPQFFFRINRQYIINIKAIKDITSYSINKLKINLLNLNNDDLTVSRHRIKEFKSWLEK
jgi:DNA-binding LytR/AlgR family response regulator